MRGGGGGLIYEKRIYLPGGINSGGIANCVDVFVLRGDHLRAYGRSDFISLFIFSPALGGVRPYFPDAFQSSSHTLKHSIPQFRTRAFNVFDFHRFYFEGSV